GSMKNAKTVCGFAAMWISHSMVSCSGSAMLASLLSFGSRFELCKACLPKGLQIATHLIQAFRTKTIKFMGTLAANTQQTSLQQHFQMLRDRRLGDIKARCNFSSREFPAFYKLQDSPPTRLGQRVKRCVHLGYFSTCLYKCQLK